MSNVEIDYAAIDPLELIEAAIGRRNVRIMATIGILICAAVAALLGRKRRKLMRSLAKKVQIQSGLYYSSTMGSIGLVFLVVGYGIGYSSGYGERLVDTLKNDLQSSMTNVMGNIFWSFLVSASAAFAYTSCGSPGPTCN